ncbi:MAG: hypothetical protein WD512_10980 [Candidatus Paceibacterota bacterium]
MNYSDTYKVNNKKYHAFTGIDTIKLFATYNLDDFPDIEAAIKNYHYQYLDKFHYWYQEDLLTKEKDPNDLKCCLKFDSSICKDIKTKYCLYINAVRKVDESGYGYVNLYVNIHLSHFLEQYFDSDIISKENVSKELNLIIKDITGKGLIYNRSLAITQVHIFHDILTQQDPKDYLNILALFKMNRRTLIFNPKSFFRTIKISKYKNSSFEVVTDTLPSFRKNDLGSIYGKSEKLRNELKDCPRHIIRFEFILRGQKKRNRRQRRLPIAIGKASVSDVINFDWHNDINKEVYQTYFGKYSDADFNSLTHKTSHHFAKLERYEFDNTSPSISDIEDKYLIGILFWGILYGKSTKEKEKIKYQLDQKLNLILTEKLGTQYGGRLGIDLIGELRDKWGNKYPFEKKKLMPNIHKIYGKKSNSITLHKK